MNDLTLRDAKPGDTEAMWALDLACFAPEFQFSRRAMRRFATAPGAITLIAESGGRLAGFCIVQIEDATAYIVTLDVDPAFRRQGLARRILHKAEARSIAAGATTIGLHVHLDNVPAMHLYERLGYEPAGQINGFYGRGLHAIIYRKHLAR